MLDFPMQDPFDPEWRNKIKTLVSSLKYDPEAHKKMGIAQLSKNMQFVNGVPFYIEPYGLPHIEGFNYLITTAEGEGKIEGYEREFHKSYNVRIKSKNIDINLIKNAFLNFRKDFYDKEGIDLYFEE